MFKFLQLHDFDTDSETLQCKFFYGLIVYFGPFNITYVKSKKRPTIPLVSLQARICTP